MDKVYAALCLIVIAAVVGALIVIASGYRPAFKSISNEDKVLPWLETRKR